MTSHIEIAQAKRQSENCVRELEGKILKINQGSRGEAHVSTKNRLPLTGTCEEPFRNRSDGELKVPSDKQRICHNYGGEARPYLIKT